MPYYKNPNKYDELQKKRLAIALDIARYFPVCYIDQFGKAHHSRSTQDPADIIRVFGKYKFTNVGMQTNLRGITGISCNPTRRRELVEALELPKHQEVVVRVRDDQIMLFKHPPGNIPKNITLAKHMVLLKDKTIIPMAGTKLVDKHHGYIDVEMWGSMRDVPEFPEALIEELDIQK